MPDAMVTADDLSVHFPTGHARDVVRAVDGVSFAVQQGEVFGIIGESGSGKSTLGRALLCLTRPTAGHVLHGAIDPFALSAGVRRKHRRGYGIIFQDPHGALNPRMTVLASVQEPLDIAGEGTRAERVKRATTLLDHVGLSTEQASRYPHQLSGGQKQRVNIARALALAPKLLVCDEAVAALDVSVQAGIINLLADLQREFGLTYVFITHDIGVVSHVSDRVAVMYLGKLMELGLTEQVERQPLHPYTQALLSAEPTLDGSGDGQRILLQGEIPSPVAPPSGCRFRTRCLFATDICAASPPEWREVTAGHFVACHFATADGIKTNANQAGARTMPRPWQPAHMKELP